MATWTALPVGAHRAVLEFASKLFISYYRKDLLKYLLKYLESSEDPEPSAGTCSSWNDCRAILKETLRDLFTLGERHEDHGSHGSEGLVSGTGLR